MSAPLRPLSTGELLDTTFSLYRSRFPLFVGLVALPYLVLLPLQILNDVRFRGSGFSFDTSRVLLTILLWVAMVIVSAASQAATLVAVSGLYLGRVVSVVGSLAKITRRIVPLCTLSVVLFMGFAVLALLLVGPGILLAAMSSLTIVSFIVLAIGSLLFVVFTVILALTFSLAVPAVVLEDRGIWNALGRSANLTAGFRLRILLIYVLFIIILTVVTVLLSLPVGVANVVMVMQNGPGTILPGWLLMLNTVSSFLTQCLVGPLMTIAIAVLYYDVRVRKEAFDLQLMMNALDGDQASA
jgi:hypothetical protein